MTMPILDTKVELFEKLRDLRHQFRKSSPRVKARDIAVGIYDSFRFSPTLSRILQIDALTALARDLVRSERGVMRESAMVSAGGEYIVEAPRFPDFDAICHACPANYALPGDEPHETVYLETFDCDFTLLKPGFDYLRKMAAGAERHATAMENLYRLCHRLGGLQGETPREILHRCYGFDPGND
jgi:hypothetical protein